MWGGRGEEGTSVFQSEVGKGGGGDNNVRRVRSEDYVIGTCGREGGRESDVSQREEIEEGGLGNCG